MQRFAPALEHAVAADAEWPLGAVLRAADHRDVFEQWWHDKRSVYRRFLESPVVDVDDLADLSAAEHRPISARLDAANMALYRTANPDAVDHATILALGRQFGLHRAERNLCADDDSVSAIEVAEDELRRRYVPYTPRALSWHTDGYYNSGENAIRSFVLHCINPAFRGGANQFLDHEILFGLLRQDANINIDALFAPDAYAIPANIDEGVEIRGHVSGAVFSIEDGALYMRFSARQRNIEWKANARILTAVEAIRYYLNHSGFVLSTTLEPGMGVISRNVLHRRDSFANARGGRRLLLRARYHDPIRPEALSGSRHALAQ